MTPAAALYQFFASAIPGWSAYSETAVPSQAAGDAYDAAFPYLTYSLPTSSFDFGEVSIAVNLWHKAANNQKIPETVMNDAANALSAAIGRGGVTLPCDGGFIWLKRGTPFAQAMQDEDTTIKRRYINITAEFCTAD